MTTPARIAASRPNGQLSRGPATPAGKAASALNSLRHGLYAAAVLPALGESPGEFAALAAAVRDDLAPDGALQEHLADRARRGAAAERSGARAGRVPTVRRRA